MEMKNWVFVSTLLLGCLVDFMSNNCCADGFRYRADGGLLEDYITIVLTESQKKAAKWWHVIKLTEKQYKKIKAINSSAYREIQVVPYRKPCCTCSVGQCMVVKPSGEGMIPTSYIGMRIYFIRDEELFKYVTKDLVKIVVEKDGSSCEIDRNNLRRGDIILFDCPKYFNSIHIRKKVDKLIKQTKTWCAKIGVKVKRCQNGFVGK